MDDWVFYYFCSIYLNELQLNFRNFQNSIFIQKLIDEKAAFRFTALLLVVRISDQRADFSVKWKLNKQKTN